MKATLLPVMLSALALGACSTPAGSDRPCPRVTDFPKDVQAAAGREIAGQPNITRMMDAMGADRAFNREVCP